jgi:glycosyltransferase involved in cell wall biosynthesis
MKPTSLLYIGNKLSKHGFNSTTIETLGKSLEDERFLVKYTSDKKNQFIRLLCMLLSICYYAKKVDYILIDTYSTSSFWYAFFCSQIARLFNIKYIPILHGGNLPNRLKKNPYLCKLIFKYSYKNITPSNYLRSAFSKDFNDNLIYIPNSFTIKNYNFNVRETNVPKLLWVRSFSKIYNPKMAIKVLYELKKKYPKAELCMVGPDKEQLVNECKLLAKSLNVEVIFTGKLSKPQWLELSKEYNIFINTTHVDNTPLSVMEAMALGLPIVSTNVGGIPYLLKNEENALLVNDNDVESMTLAIKRIFENKNLAKLITINSRKTVESFDWSKVKQKWFEILK